MSEIKNSPAMLSVLGDIENQMGQTNDREAARNFDQDTKLGWLVGHLGSVATTTRRPEALLRVAAVSFAWLESLGIQPLDVMLKVSDEWIRQRRLFREHTFTVRVDSPVVSTWRKLRVLTEEVGEFAEAIDDLEDRPKNKKLLEHLIEELVQVAAVAVAWLESFESTLSPKGK